MKKSDCFPLLWAICCLITAAACSGTKTEPWDPEQLMPPGELAASIGNPESATPLIICIGPSGLIKGSREVGQTKEQENLDKLERLLAQQDKDTDLVLYCGCCPFRDCPNIRPAFSLANRMGFTNHKLLDLSQNLKTDWIDKGYPVDN